MKGRFKALTRCPGCEDTLVQAGHLCFVCRRRREAASRKVTKTLQPDRVDVALARVPDPGGPPRG